MPIGLSSELDVYATLSAMITPAIFLTANGSLIISTSNRMSRIVDRIRVLNDLGDRIGRRGSDFDYPKERLANVEDELDRLVWRSYRIRYALVALYLAFGAFVGTSLTLAIDVWTRRAQADLPADAPGDSRRFPDAGRLRQPGARGPGGAPGQP